MPSSLETEAKILRAEEEVDHLASSIGFRTRPIKSGEIGEAEHKPNLCETRVGMLGTFAVGDDIVRHMIYSSRSTQYEISVDEVMTVLGFGLEQVAISSTEEKEYVDSILEECDQYRPFAPQPNGARLIAAVQVMLDTEEGEFRSGLVYNRELEDASYNLRNFCFGLQSVCPEIARHNDAVANLINPQPGTMDRVSVALAQASLPDSLEEFYGQV